MISEKKTENEEAIDNAPSSNEKEMVSMVITVIGDGQARAIPDQAVVLAIVMGSAVTASQALHDSAGRLAQVVQAVLARGLTRAEIQVTWTNVVPSGPTSYQAPGTLGGYSPPGNGQGQLPAGIAPVSGFIASFGLQIVLRDPNRLGEIIDTTITAGASFSSGTLIRLRDETLARNIALEAACQAANVKAAHLAARWGRPLGRVISLVEENVNSSLNVTGTGSIPAMGLNGEIIFHTQVRISYELG
jgi:uncharacterized protein